MKLKTRIISLFLTVLMIVGLLPMSLFAVDGSKAVGDEEYTGTEWTAPDLEDIVNAFYPDIDDPYNSSNWEKIFTKDFADLTWSSSSATDENGLKSAENNLSKVVIGNRKSGVTIVAEGDDKGAVYFGKSAEGATEGNTSGDYVSAITMGVSSAAKVPVLHAQQGHAGRDFLVSFDYKPETIENAESLLEIVTRFEYSKADGTKVTRSPAGMHVLKVGKDESGQVPLYLGSNGMKICDLPTDAYTNIKVLVDVGGPEAGASSNMLYVFINDKLMASGPFITDTGLLADMYGMETNGNPAGFCFCEARIWRGTSYKTNSAYVNDLQTYYFGTTETSRDVNIYAYLDFNEWTSEIGNPLTSLGKYFSTSDATIDDVGLGGGSKLQSITSALVINNHYKSVYSNVKAVDDGNDGAAMQWSYNEKSKTDNPDKENPHETYMDISNGNAANPYTKANQGRDFVFSIDVKLGNNIVSTNKLFTVYTREPEVASWPVGADIIKLDADGTLKAGGAGTDDEKNTVIGSLNSSAFTTITVRFDVSENLFYVWLNGVAVDTDGDGNADGFTAFQQAHFDVFEKKGGFAFHAVRVNQINSYEVNREIYDNAVVYFVDDSIKGIIGENKDPLNGFVKKDDGYLYYYENGSIAANYDNGFVKTDADGVVLLKERTPFIDWEKTSPKDKPSNQIANLADWNGKGDGYNQYYNHINSTVGDDASALHLWSNMTNLGGGDTTFAIIPNSLGKTYWDKNGKEQQGDFLDISNYSELEIDIYADGYQEFVAMMYLGLNDKIMYNVSGACYYSSFINFGTKDYGNGYGAPNASNKGWGSIDVFNNLKFRVNGWTTASIPIPNGGSRTDQVIDSDGNKLNPKEYISQFKFHSVGWGQLDRKYVDENMTDYVLNGTDCRFLIKDIYLVNYKKVESLSEIAEYVGGDLVPLNGAACFSGLYTAPSGNLYYYSAYDHSRVTDKPAYDIMGNETVTGYSFDANGVATPLNGVHTVQTKRTHLYVDGVMQKGSAADEFKVTVDGVDYRINAEGDYLGAYYFTDFMAEYPKEYDFAGDSLADVDFEFENEIEKMHLSASTSSQLSIKGTKGEVRFDNGGKLNMSVITDDFFEEGNNVLKLDFVNSERDGYAQVAVGNKATASDGQNVVFEYDLRLGDDWNGNLNIQFNSRGGKTNSYSEYYYDKNNKLVDKNALQIVFKINERGELTNSAGDKVFYQFSADEFSKIAFVAKYEYVNTKDVTIGSDQIKDAQFYNLKIDAYVNGVKVAENVVAYENRSYKYMTEIRFAALATDSSNNRSGSLYFDNFALYYGDNIVPQYVSTEPLNGVVGGKYYDNGQLLVSGTKEVGDVFYSADADGWLKFNTGVSEGSDGKYYNFVGFAGRICDGIIDEKYYIDGALKSGLFEDEGKWMFADPENSDILVKEETGKDINGKIYDIANYIVTVRNGIIENKYWDDGVYQTGIIQVDGGIYCADAEGVLQHFDEKGVEIDGAVYDFEGYLGKARNGFYIFEEGTDTEYAYFYKDGVILKDQCIDAGLGDKQYYFADAEGKLIKQTGNFEMTDGYTYNFDGYVATLLHEVVFDGKYWFDGAIVTGKDIAIEEGKIYCADEDGNLVESGIAEAHDGKYYFFENYVGTLLNNEVKEGRYWIDGAYVINTDIQIGDGTIYSADSEGNLRANGVFQANNGLYYNFDANYVGTLCDNYEIFDDVWYVGGKPIEGIHYIDDVERYFEAGKPCAGRVQMPDGTVHEFGEDGFRSSDDKKPHSIKLTLKYNGTEVTKEFYSYDGFGFTYTPINIDCMGYTITDKDGKVIDKIDVAAVTEDLEYVITYNSDTKSHTPVISEDIESTCTVAGRTTYVCAVCGEELPELTVVKPLIDHKYVEVSRTESTCTVKGTVNYECEFCKTPASEELPLAAHTWDSGVRTAPTCAVAGKTVYTCTADGCGETKTVILPATGIHVWELTETVESTCAEMGHKTYTCSVCGEPKTYDLPLLAHTYDPDGEYEVLQEATATTSGVLGYDCIVCEKKNAIAIEYAISSDAFKDSLEKGGTLKVSDSFVWNDQVWMTDSKSELILGEDSVLTVEGDGIIDLSGNAELVIDGKGKLNQTFDSKLGYLVRAAGNSKVTIKDGHFTAGLTAVQAGENAVVEIYGGYFEALATFEGKTWILNLIDKDKFNAKIIVYGGTFVNYDPSNSETEDPAMNFVAEGYKVVMTTDEATGNKIYTVVPEE